jgi:hypothetical protein
MSGKTTVKDTSDMGKSVATLSPNKAGEIIEAVIARGDIAALTPDERAKYYVSVCKSVGLNPMTRPFEYITLNGKLVLYARKDATDQLRAINNVSVTDLEESEREGVFVVTAKVRNGAGRTDASKGAVTITGLKGDALANALMKAETKAKRRATLSICGLGFVLDETEIETVPAEAKVKRYKTLPKAEARVLFENMQNEIRAITTTDAVVDWLAENAERIKLLPEDWQDLLNLKAQEQRFDLKIKKPATVTAIHAPSEALKEIEEELAKVQSADQLEDAWAFVVDPRLEGLSAADQELARGLFRATEQRFEQ